MKRFGVESARFALASVVLVVALLLSAQPARPAVPIHTRYRSDRLLIQPKTGHSAVALANTHAAAGARIRRHFTAMGGLLVLKLPPGLDPEAAVRIYQKSGQVQFAEPDYWLRPAVVPNDPAFTDGTLWHLQNTGQSGGIADADIDAPEGWDTMHSASNIIVALVDTGIRYTHEDLASNLWVNPGEIAGNGLDDDANGFIDDVHGINAAVNTGDPWDVHGHGTKVAGVLGAVGNNSSGVTGVAWRGQLMACRFYDDAGYGSLSDAVQCFDYARAKGARVINASFVATAYSAALYTAINTCRNAGILIVAAAGNDAVNNDSTPYYPASFNLDNILSVAATTRTDDLASYSNYGATTVDLAAPGSSIYSTANSSDTAYTIDSGTSFAAPVVAGAAALLRARYPAETYLQIIDRIKAGTDPLPGLTGKCVTGGRLNLSRALGPSVVADFTATPASGLPPLVVQFTDTSFGSLTHWLWDFGDGATSTEQNPTHLYPLTDPYTATLTVTGSAGLTSTITRIIRVVANYSITNALFSWVDPSAMTAIPLADDGVSTAQGLPFTFRFYGQTFQQLYVGANGLVGFDTAGLSASNNTDLPNTNLPNNIICPFWDNLNPAAGGTVRIGTVGEAPNRAVVVSWVAVRHATLPPATYTFQVLLEETTHRIRFQYQSVTPGLGAGTEGRSATVGIENAEGTVAARYSFNGSTLLTNNTALVWIPSTTGRLSVTPPDPLVSIGITGGPFTPSEQPYTLTNTGDGPLEWAVTNNQPWLGLSATRGVLDPQGTTNVVLFLSEEALPLPPGTYSDTVAFVNTGNSRGDTARAVTLRVLSSGVLEVEPSQAVLTRGHVGGPFVPSAQIFSLTNAGRGSLVWSATHTAPWLALSAAQGNLAPGSTVTVTAQLTAEAAQLGSGVYDDVITFDWADGSGPIPRAIRLTVSPPPRLSLSLPAPYEWLELILHGEPSWWYVIEASPDFASWSPVVTNQAAAEGILVVTDPIRAAERQWFYRARIASPP